MDIFRYTDFRVYLADWRKAEKARNPAISHEYLGRRLGVSNRAYFNDVEKGRRDVGPSMFDRLVKLLKLDNTQSHYFRAMIGYGQPASSTEKEYWFGQLVALNHTPYRIIDEDTWEYFRHSHHAVVRALLDTFSYRGDAKDAANRLNNRISPEQFQESIELLCKLVLVIKNEDGIYRQTEKVLSTGDRAQGELIRQYQNSVLEELRAIVSAGIPGTHDSNSLTLSISPKGAERIIARLRQLRKEIVSIANKDEDPATEVYRVSMHIHGLTKGAQV